MPKIGIVTVPYGHDAKITKLLDEIGKQKQKGDYFVLVDNHPKHKSAAIAEKHGSVDKVVRGDNIGLFAGGCNRGAAELPPNIDLLFFLNPDTIPEPGSLDEIRNGDEKWGAWMPLLLLPDGKVNSAGNVLHISGLSWVSHFGEDASKFQKPMEVSLLSGACMVIRKKVWQRIKGFNEIMYYEDVDISLRMRLLGYKLGLLPGAKVTHDYEFKKGDYKNFYIERNRYLSILRAWPLGVIVVMTPLLLIVEPGLWLISILQRRFLLRWKSVGSAVKAIPAAIRERAKIQSNRKITSEEFLKILEPNANSPLIGILGKVGIFSLFFRLYYSLAKIVLS